jgi:hypothetical protein
MCPVIVPCNPGNTIKSKKCQSISKSDRKIIETDANSIVITEAFSIVLKHLYMTVDWLGTGTSIKMAELNYYYGSKPSVIVK